MATIRRREFLRHATLAGAWGIPRWAGLRYSVALQHAGIDFKLRILHTNDHHSRIEPFSVALKTDPEPDVVRDFGGMARRKTLIDQLRSGAALDEHVVVLDAGDVFQGTLYFTQFSGQADLFFYNGMHYDAVTVGNHEFDRGQAVLRDFILGANFPMLCANIDVQPTAVLAAALGPTEVASAGRLGKRVLISRGGKRIGIFGLSPPSTNILSNVGPGVTFGAQLAAVAQSQADALIADGADYVIGLTHIGYSADLQLASQVRGVRAILGGHSHTPLLPTSNPAPLGVDPDGPYPTIVADAEGRNVVVTSDYKWGAWLGDLTMGFSASGDLASLSGVIRPVWAGGLGNPPRALLPGEGSEIPPDGAYHAQIEQVYKPHITALQSTVVGRAAVMLDGDRVDVRNRETNLGNLIADLMLARLRPDGGQLAMLNSGSIGRSISSGDVTLARVIEALPFDNTIARVDLTGAQLLASLENAVSQVSAANPNNSAGRFVQVSGLSFTWARGQPVGRRILSARVSPSGSGPAVPIDPAAVYRIVTNNFMLAGGDGFAALAQGANPSDTGFTLVDMLSDHFRVNSPVAAYVEGRIVAAARISLPWIQRGAVVSTAT
jgi:5'-nucleotidase